MSSNAPRFEETGRWDRVPGGSALSWPAVLAGATAAAALSLILLVLGTGLGLAVVSPWAERGASVETMSWSTIAWIAFAALASSGLGGYLAGRLRVRWPSLRVDEVYFRDTAHGFLAWAVATLLTAAALTSAIGVILGAGAKVGAAAAQGAAQIAGQQAADSAQAVAGDGSGNLYYVDSLFRTTPQAPIAPTAGTIAGNDAATRGEIGRILDISLRDGSLSAADRSYIGQVVAQRTGLSPPDADERVTAAYDTARQRLRQAEATAKELADKAREAGAWAALWIFVSLLGGAFFASLMATVGGRQRDMF